METTQHCPKCNTEKDESARRCPNCGHVPGGSTLLIGIGRFLIVVVVVAFCAVGSCAIGFGAEAVLPHGYRSAGDMGFGTIFSVSLISFVVLSVLAIGSLVRRWRA